MFEGRGAWTAQGRGDEVDMVDGFYLLRARMRNEDVAKSTVHAMRCVAACAFTKAVYVPVGVITSRAARNSECRD